MSGFLKLQRKFYNHWLWEEERSLSKAEAWLDLLQLAAFAPYKKIVKGKLIGLEQGELIASVRFLAKRWVWGKDKSAKFMSLLESDNMIRRISRQGETIVSLCKYSDYAALELNDQTVTRTPTRQGADSDQTVTRTKDKKVKKNKKIKKEEEELSLPFDSSEFSQAWAEWITYRKAKRITVTPITMTRQLKMLGKQVETDAIVMLNQSMDNGWSGLFPPKGNQDSAPAAQKQTKEELLGGRESNRIKTSELTEEENNEPHPTNEIPF